MSTDVLNAIIPAAATVLVFLIIGATIIVGMVVYYKSRNKNDE